MSMTFRRNAPWLHSLAPVFVLLLAGCTGVPAASTSIQLSGSKWKENDWRSHGHQGAVGADGRTISKKIIPGKTTKEEIRALFGPCLKVALTDSGENWTYESSVVTIFSGASYTRNVLIILFDDRGVVKRYSMNVDEKKR